jgi:hypothetical protein
MSLTRKRTTRAGSMVESVTVTIAGSPSAAENPPKDAIWRRAVADAVRGRPRAATVTLHFRLEPKRWRIDIDNLTRLALDGLRDGGVLEQGLGSVWLIEAHTAASVEPGLDVTLTDTTWLVGGRPLQADSLPGLVELDAEIDAIPREGKVDEKRAWRTAVQHVWRDPPLADPVFIDIWTRTGGSLAATLKPVIDGLEAFLGRDPQGRLEFCPNDDRVMWLRIVRVAIGPALRVRAGRMDGRS